MTVRAAVGVLALVLTVGCGSGLLTPSGQHVAAINLTVVADNGRSAGAGMANVKVEAWAAGGGRHVTVVTGSGGAASFTITPRRDLGEPHAAAGFRIRAADL